MYWAARVPRACRGHGPRAARYTDVLVDLPTASSRGAAGRRSRAAASGCRPSADPTRTRSAQFLIADREHPNSIVNTVERSRENLRTSREVLPREAWQTVNDLSIYVRGAAVTSVERRRRDRFLARVIDESQRLDGVLQSTMTRDEVYEMWRLGRYIERADMTTRVLGVRAATLLSLPAGDVDEFAEVQWMGVLRSLSALQMYQRATRGPIDGPAVVQVPAVRSSVPALGRRMPRRDAHVDPASAGVLDGARRRRGGRSSAPSQPPGRRRRRRARRRDGRRAGGTGAARHGHARAVRRALSDDRSRPPPPDDRRTPFDRRHVQRRWRGRRRR